MPFDCLELILACRSFCSQIRIRRNWIMAHECIKHLQNNIIEVSMIGKGKGKTLFIPRIPLISNELRFGFKPLQFLEMLISIWSSTRRANHSEIVTSTRRNLASRTVNYKSRAHELDHWVFTLKIFSKTTRKLLNGFKHGFHCSKAYCATYKLRYVLLVCIHTFKHICKWWIYSCF